jgi:hypothetical protein
MEEMAMKIPVIYINGLAGTISNEDLDSLLKMKVIKSFQRSTGWATVGRDELRKNREDKTGSWKNRKINNPIL